MSERDGPERNDRPDPPDMWPAATHDLVFSGPPEYGEGLVTFAYRDLGIPGAVLTKCRISITVQDEVHLTAHVQSKDSQAKKKGPHHFLTLSLVLDGVRKSKAVPIGEFRWHCGQNGVLASPSISVPGAYAGSETPPKWRIESPALSKC